MHKKYKHATLYRSEVTGYVNMGILRKLVHRSLINQLADTAVEQILFQSAKSDSNCFFPLKKENTLANVGSPDKKCMPNISDQGQLAS